MTNHNNKKVNIIFSLSSLCLFLTVFVLDFYVKNILKDNTEHTSKASLLLPLSISLYFMINFHDIVSKKVWSYFVSLFIGLGLAIIGGIISAIVIGYFHGIIITKLPNDYYFSVLEYTYIGIVFVLSLILHIYFRIILKGTPFWQKTIMWPEFPKEDKGDAL